MWVLWREQVAFEESARQIKAVMTRDQWQKLVRWNSSAHPAMRRFDANHVRVGLTWVVWPNAIYCIYYRMPGIIPGEAGSGDYDTPCSSVEVFRIPPVPRGYQPQTEFNRQTRLNNPAVNQELWYIEDFLDYISGERKDHPVFKLKLIYADPPASR